MPKTCNLVTMDETGAIKRCGGKLEQKKITQTGAIRTKAGERQGTRTIFSCERCSKCGHLSQS